MRVSPRCGTRRCLYEEAWVPGETRHRGAEDGAARGGVEERQDVGMMQRGGAVDVAGSTSVAELRVQPRPGLGPLPLDRAGGDSQRLGGFLLGQSSEEPALDHPAHPRAETGKPLQRLVHRHQQVAPLGGGRVVVEEIMGGAASSPDRPMPPGIVDQNAAHGTGRGSEELGAILPVHPVQVRQLHVGFVHQPGRAEGVVRPLALELAVGDAPQVLIDGGIQSLQGIGIAAACFL